MKNLLYLGNKLSVHGNTATGIEVLGPLLEEEGFRIRYASSKKNKFARMADMLWTVVCYGRKSDFVLIDTYSTMNFWYAFLCSRLCKRMKVKYIPILHGGNLPRRLRMSPVMSAKLFGDAYVNVAPSKYLAKIFYEEGFNVRYIPNPIDIAAFPFYERVDVRPRLIWVRSIARIYNPQMALEVLQAMQKKHPDAELVMVGPDKENRLPKLKEFAAHHKLNVVFKGRMSKSDWADLSRGYDIFINTAKVDNAPFSLLEAASLGLLIVSNNVGGIPHIFTHKKEAMLVTPGDAKAMARAVEELLADAALRREMISNREQLLERYQWKTIREDWLEILD